MEQIIVKASDFITSFEGSMMTIAIVVEFVFRLFPTEKPLNLFVAIAKMLQMTGNLLVQVGSFLDKVLPQKIK